ncbi:4997_t:CDS:2 [Paraglomus occultum]|uniref:4997_t:CDS:1 n=1 Tax=Paraglomus occultum TaxID=144539 RepID=A0A9N9BS21_9GLOM|nr:4997_t:CDS:2 [Paraglomus occultum]
MSQLNDGENGWIENCINNRIIKLYQFSTSEIQKGRATIEESGSMVVLQAILQFRDIGQTHFYNSKEFAAETSDTVHVHNGTAKISAFGLSRLDRKSAINLKHNSAYTDVLYSITQNYKHNKKSDVYSLGVLLWEISGGIPSSDSDLNKLTPVEGTPDDYIELYKQCRDRDLVKRLTCKEILRKLEDILRRNDLMKIDNEDLILRPSENHLYTTWLLTIIEKQTTRGRIDHHARNFVINWLTNNNYDVENILNTLRRHDETCGHCCALIGFFYHVGVGTSAASAGFVKDMPESKIRWMMDKAMIG